MIVHTVTPFLSLLCGDVSGKVGPILRGEQVTSLLPNVAVEVILHSRELLVYSECICRPILLLLTWRQEVKTERQWSAKCHCQSDSTLSCELCTFATMRTVPPFYTKVRPTCIFTFLGIEMDSLPRECIRCQSISASWKGLRRTYDLHTNGILLAARLLIWRRFRRAAW